jgi:hypothetical protein
MSASAARADRARLARWPIAAALAAPATIQIGLILWAIWVAPVQVPWQDELFHFNFFTKARAGEAGWADFWQPLGGVHRTVFPRLLYVLSINTSDWDRRVWLTINPLLIAGACAALWATARRTTGSRPLALALLAAVGALLFAPSQYSQWLQPFGLQFALVVACGTLALWALCAGRGSWPSFALAVGATWVASWSGLHGLALWVATLPLVALAGWRKAIVWIACVALVIGTYASDLPRQGSQGLAPGTLIAFALANLGAPLGTLQAPTGREHFWDHTAVALDQRWALWIGAASVALLLVNLFVAWRQGGHGREHLARYLPWCCLAAFAVACALLTGVGRASASASSALTSRYQTFALLWWVAIVAIGAQVAATAWAARREGGADWLRVVIATNLLTLGVGALLFAWVNVVSGLLLRDLHGELRQSEACARDLANAPDDCLILLHPVPSVARLRLATLAGERLALFRAGPVPVGAGAPTPPATAPDRVSLRQLPFGALYALDGLPGPLAPFDGTPPPPRFAAGQPLQLSGWAVDTIGIPPGPAGGVFLTIDDRPPVWVPITGERPEVAARFGAQLVRSGFRLELPTGTLAPGRHTVRIAVVTGDGRAVYRESPGLVFVVE